MSLGMNGKYRQSCRFLQVVLIIFVILGGILCGCSAEREVPHS